MVTCYFRRYCRRRRKHLVLRHCDYSYLIRYKKGSLASHTTFTFLAHFLEQSQVMTMIVILLRVGEGELKSPNSRDGTGAEQRTPPPHLTSQASFLHPRSFRAARPRWVSLSRSDRPSSGRTVGQPAWKPDEPTARERKREWVRRSSTVRPCPRESPERERWLSLLRLCQANGPEPTLPPFAASASLGSLPR